MRLAALGVLLLAACGEDGFETADVATLGDGGHISGRLVDARCWLGVGGERRDCPPGDLRLRHPLALVVDGRLVYLTNPPAELRRYLNRVVEAKVMLSADGRLARVTAIEARAPP